MTDGADLGPTDGVWPGEAAWLGWEPPVAPSADLLDRLHDAVVQDLATIRAEADRVDEFAFPPGWLEAYRVPLPSEGFARRTLSAVQRLRSDGPAVGRDAAEDLQQDSELARALAGYGVPEPSPDFVHRTIAALADGADPELDALMGRDAAPDPSADFVDRTLSAVMADRRNRERVQPLRSVPLAHLASPTSALAAPLRSAPAPRDDDIAPTLRAQMRTAWSRRAARWGAAAAVLLSIGVLWTGGAGSGRGSVAPRPSLVVASSVPVASVTHTPAPIAAAMARASEPVGGTALVPDSLLLLASGALESR